jgi:hypothetical protein
MLNAFVDTSIKERSVEVFNGDVGIIVLQYLWKKYAKRSHIRSTFHYLLYIFLFTWSVYSYSFLRRDYGKKGINAALFTQCATLLFTLYYFVQEAVQIWNESKDNSVMALKFGGKNTKLAFLRDLYNHFRNDIWNFNDLMIVLLVSSGTILRLIFVDDTNKSRCCLAAASICVYFKILYFMRPFAVSGPLGKILFYFLSINLLIICMLSFDDFADYTRHRIFFGNFGINALRFFSSILDFIQQQYKSSFWQ